MSHAQAMWAAFPEMADVSGKSCQRHYCAGFLHNPTASFRILFVLLILSHDRRRILHLNVTEHPSAAWTAQQLLEACGLDEQPGYLLRDRDAIYGLDFRRQAACGFAGSRRQPAMNSPN
jgi:hypothetical protein